MIFALGIMEYHPLVKKAKVSNLAISTLVERDLALVYFPTDSDHPSEKELMMVHHSLFRFSPLLPFRQTISFPSIHELGVFFKIEFQKLKESFLEIKDLVEFHLFFELPAEDQIIESDQPGKYYFLKKYEDFKQKKKGQETVQLILDKLLEEVNPVSINQESSLNPSIVLSKGDVEIFKKQCLTVMKDFNAIQLKVSGPWLPYTIINPIKLKIA